MAALPTPCCTACTAHLLAHGAADPQGECRTAHARLCSAGSPHSMHSTHLLAHGAAHRGQGPLAAKQPGVAGAQLCRVASAAGQPSQGRRVGSKGMITCRSSTGARRRCCSGRQSRTAAGTQAITTAELCTAAAQNAWESPPSSPPYDAGPHPFPSASACHHRLTHRCAR